MYGQYETIFASRNETFQQIAAPGDLFIILFFFFFYFFTLHASRKTCITKFTIHPQEKGGLSRHHAMHHFRAITPINLLFHKSRPEKRVNIPIGVPQ